MRLNFNVIFLCLIVFKVLQSFKFYYMQTAWSYLEIILVTY